MVSAQADSANYVILVDDDTGMSASVQFLLQSEQIRCECFASGAEFIERIKQDPALIAGPGCILLDMRMPGMNGSEAFDQLRVMPVIFLTAHGDVPLVTRVLTLGATDFIQKPASAETLLEKIRGYFAISQARRQNMQKLQDILERIASLTGRERAVMNLLYEGLANKDIAEKLGNSVRTIELRRAAVYDKLRVHSAIELARLLQGIDWSG
jgi:two-component system, LuxR family, response regulator DctR